jgi:RimJ/RimL family protein N-acetyltransferase
MATDGNKHNEGPLGMKRFSSIWDLPAYQQMRQQGASPADMVAFYNQVETPLDVAVRVATADDVIRYFDWANDPDTRQQSFNSEPILWEDHQAWFARKLTDSNALLLVFDMTKNEPVGQVRFERQGDDEVIIGVSIDRPYRGKGLASRLIAEGCRVCRAVWGNVSVSAYIKPDNQPSIRAFERAGFVYSHESRKFGVESVCLVLQPA